MTVDKIRISGHYLGHYRDTIWDFQQTLSLGTIVPGILRLSVFENTGRDTRACSVQTCHASIQDRNIPGREAFRTLPIHEKTSLALW